MRNVQDRRLPVRARVGYSGSRYLAARNWSKIVRGQSMRIAALVAAGLVLATAVDWCAAAGPAAGSGDETEARFAGLIQQLGDPQFAVRQRAQQELIKSGLDAF